MLDWEVSEASARIAPRGQWTVALASRLDRLAASVALPRDIKTVVIDMGGVEDLDTAGAWLLTRTSGEWRARGHEVAFEHLSDKYRVLLDEVGGHDLGGGVAADKDGRALALVADTGHSVIEAGRDLARVTGILGATVGAFLRVLANPSRLRVTSIVHHLEHIGLRAVGIIALMSFLIGGIIAQQGAFQLAKFGADLFVVDLVGILVLRELGVLLTAIMFAGRSGSAFTAELGAMKMREEIDAMRIIGLDPVETLILPRLIALVIALPILTFISDIMCLAGAGMLLQFYMDMQPDIYISRLRESVSDHTFMVGMSKAPFMALVIGLISCVEGLKVEGSAESLGLRTTSAVVKSIFIVIVLDGLFAIFYSAMDW
ncbi:MAG: MlaE family lipid ABC transporter permease subunit [Rhodobiaceae bacterium]|nr:MlaE family lipid ABC transporter permease subunit [Rhodobiaceae bacterium]